MRSDSQPGRSDSVPKIGDVLDDVDTPALIVELDALERNVAAMAAAVEDRGVRLRPHAKSHKSPDIARRQLAAGAVGICCQKVGEAEAFVAAGVTDVLITNEIVGAAKLARLALLSRNARLGVLVDDRVNVGSLAAAMRAAGASIDVLVEVDVGAHRCGVLPGAPALELARAIADESGLRFAGLHAYQGAAQHLRRPAERRAAIARAAELAFETKALIEQAGIECDSGIYTELQPGSYVFMDADYGRNERADGEIRFEQSLFVWTTVMSTPAPDRAIVDAGLKAFAVDSGMPLVAHAPGLELTKASDEHGVVRIAPGATGPRLGERLKLVPGHCDPTVNLYDWIVAVRNHRVEALWPVAARGALT
jgi:D-serine deaminase-like pyridoxal phosphate-dependent protein